VRGQTTAGQQGRRWGHRLASKDRGPAAEPGGQPPPARDQTGARPTQQPDHLRQPAWHPGHPAHLGHLRHLGRLGRPGHPGHQDVLLPAR
jgi:hypothetical protein